MPTRTTKLVAVEGGNVYTVANGVMTLVSVNSTSFEADSRVAAATAFGKVYFCDGYVYKVYDGWTDTMATWTATAGDLPEDSDNRKGRLLALYRGRIVVSGLPGDPHNWFMSAMDDPTDWDYSPATVTEAVAVAGNNSVVGLVGDVITALMPLSDDVLVFGGDHTVYQMTGDPAAGGRIDLVTDGTGVAWDAWCKDPTGALWFFGGRGGVYRYAPGHH